MGGFRVFCSTNLLISASTDESNFSAPAEDDVGAFIRFSVTGLASSPNPGRYFHLVNNCLGLHRQARIQAFWGRRSDRDRRGGIRCTVKQPRASVQNATSWFCVFDGTAYEVF